MKKGRNDEKVLRNNEKKRGEDLRDLYNDI